jgi:hypothetical protein
MIRRRHATLAVALASLGVPGLAAGPLSVRVDAQASRRRISPLIYGVNWGSPQQLAELNAPLNRHGGNATSRYNWQLNASNRGRDWYYQSTPWPDATPGEAADSFVRDSRGARAEPMLTIPMLGWAARLGPERAKLASFSIAKYGAQAEADTQWFPDAGNGLRSDGSPLTGNDPSDANLRVAVAHQRRWLEHLVARWGQAGADGVRYYLLDNEPSLWHSTHRDVQPTGTTMRELRDRIIETASMIKDVDAGALVLGPEEWGWSGYFHSGFDLQWGAAHGWDSPLPDRAANGDLPYLPWLLDQLRRAHERAGRRLLDVFSVHYYPQGGESSDDVSPAAQRLRNRSTRSLWDPDYRDESWIADHVRLIPRLRDWVGEHCPGTLIGITEYDWGAQHHISGALAQADVLGIFGREGLDIATRWEAPALGSPAFNAMRMYRNYDGAKSSFGDISVAMRVDDPDRLAAFGAERSSDGALTLMLLNKDLGDAAPLTLELGPAAERSATAQRWQLTARNVIERVADLKAFGARRQLTLPAQSITLLVLPRAEQR